jgi:hypothetical protein
MKKKDQVINLYHSIYNNITHSNRPKTHNQIKKLSGFSLVFFSIIKGESYFYQASLRDEFIHIKIIIIGGRNIVT